MLTAHAFVPTSRFLLHDSRIGMPAAHDTPMTEIAGTQPVRAAETSGFLDPERIVANLGLRPGMVVADFGTGSGYFTLPAARRVGEGGKVFAIDIQRHALDLVRSKANLERLLNIETIWADLERPSGSHLPGEAVDFVIIANILFQAEAKGGVLAEARRVLRRGGRLALLEWDEAPTSLGPPVAIRIPKRLARQLAEAAGFELEKEFEAGGHHYGFLFVKTKNDVP